MANPTNQPRQLSAASFTDAEIADLVLEGLSVGVIVSKLLASADGDSSDRDLVATLLGRVESVRCDIHADLLTFILSPSQDPEDGSADLFEGEAFTAPGGLA